jgi:hypothetical protein
MRAGGVTVATARVRLPMNAASDALRPQAMQRAAQARAPTPRLCRALHLAAM